jgi:hypothetical protein
LVAPCRLQEGPLVHGVHLRLQALLSSRPSLQELQQHQPVHTLLSHAVLPLPPLLRQPPHLLQADMRQLSHQQDIPYALNRSRVSRRSDFSLHSFFF